MKIISIKETYNWKGKYEVVVGDIEYYQNPFDGPSKEIIEHGVKSLVFLKEIAPDVYTYGVKQLTDGVHHKAGYIWSSRASAVNKILNTDLIEVCIPCRGYSTLLTTVAIPVACIQKILPEGYKIIKNRPWRDDTEEVYWIVKEDYDESSAN